MFFCFFCLDSKFSVDSSLKFTHRMISVLWPPDPYLLFRVSSAIGINCKSIPSIYSASFAVKISNVWDNKVLCITLKIFSPYNISIGQPRLIQHSIISPLQPLFIPIQFNSAAQSCPTLCNLIDFSTPGFPFHHQLLEVTQIHVHWVGDAIQPSHPLSSPSSPMFNLSQHQGLFKWVSSLHEGTKVLEFQLQHQSSQWIFRTDFLYSY